MNTCYLFCLHLGFTHRKMLYYYFRIFRKLAHNNLRRLEKGTFKDLMELQQLYLYMHHISTTKPPPILLSQNKMPRIQDNFYFMLKGKNLKFI